MPLHEPSPPQPTHTDTALHQQRAAPKPQAFKALKSIIVAVIFAAVDRAGNNPFFGAVHYAGPNPAPPEPAPCQEALQAEEVLSTAVVDLRAAVDAVGPDGLQGYLRRRGFKAEDAAPSGGDPRGSRRGAKVFTELHADAVVVGSGAGGGVAAAQLAAAGLRVIVLEKGAWKRMQDLTLLEGESTKTMFERGGECWDLGVGWQGADCLLFGRAQQQPAW